MMLFPDFREEHFVYVVFIPQNLNNRHAIERNSVGII
jgi:hypothetical protein